MTPANDNARRPPSIWDRPSYLDLVKSIFEMPTDGIESLLASRSQPCGSPERSPQSPRNLNEGA